MTATAPLVSLIGATSLFAVIAGAACASGRVVDDADAAVIVDGAVDAPSAPCSNGPRYGANTYFPVDLTATATAPCTLHCGDVERVVNCPFTIADLPSGACAPEGSSCGMGAAVPCCDPGQSSPVNSYVCKCSAGVWACSVSGVGLGGCSRCDGG